MTHWGWYWKVKKKHVPKALCSSESFHAIDSFYMFKIKELVRLVKESPGKESFSIPDYGLIAKLQDDNSLSVQFNEGSYVIPVEKKPCNYGGFYFFFHCPQCNKRMRKLYCIQGRYLCRKCANLGYLSQRLIPSDRYSYMSRKVKSFLEKRAGYLENKPPHMKRHTFQKQRRKYVKYDEMRFYANNLELSLCYGPKIEPYLDNFYPFFIPYGLVGDWVERESSF